MQYWRIAADGGCPYGMMCLASGYGNGNGGLVKDYSQAVALYIAAADTGDSEALAKLAGFYLHGFIFEVDFKKAEDLFRKAAAQGSEEAEKELYHFDGAHVKSGGMASRMTAESTAAMHGSLTLVVPFCTMVARTTSNDNARLIVAEMNAIGQVNYFLNVVKSAGGIYRDNTEQWDALQKLGELSDDELAGLQKITVLCLSETGSFCSFCLAPGASKKCSLCLEANYCSAGGVVLYCANRVKPSCLQKTAADRPQPCLVSNTRKVTILSLFMLCAATLGVPEGALVSGQGKRTEG